MSCGSESTTAPASTGSVSTRMAAGSAVSSCSGRVMRSKKRQTGRNASLTVTSASRGCCSCCSTGPWCLVAYVSPGSSRRRWPSATEYCRDRYVTTAWATVSRTVWEVMSVLPSSPGPAVQDHGLDVGHLGHRRAGALLADAARLQSAVGHEVGPPQRGPVDVHGAGVDLPDGPDGTGNVGSEDARAEPVGGAVGLRDRALEVLGRADRDGRAEQLLPAEGRPGIYPRDHGRGDDGAVAPAARQQLGSLVYGAADGFLDPLGFFRGDQRAHGRVRGSGVPGPDRLHLGHQRVEEVRGDGRVGDDALHRDADLASVDVAAG